MAVRKKTNFDPTKNLKLIMACGLEKDVLGSEKREAAFLVLNTNTVQRWLSVQARRFR